MKKLLFLIAAVAAIALTGCIEDGVTTSAADQPVFSVDTLDIGTVFSGQPTPTYSFVVYNRHDKILNISNIALRNADKRVFRINVDGTAGSAFSNIEIRPNDSIYVFVEATVPRGSGRDVTEAVDYIDFTTNGIASSVVLKATGQDVDVHRALTITADTRWEGPVVHQVFDTLTVAEGATLTLARGVQLLFHDKGHLSVKGRLITEGTPDEPVVMAGDRTDNVVGQLPFDLLASQWDGVVFHRSSAGSRLSHTIIKNTVNGVLADSVGAPGLEIVNCRFRNSAGYSFCGYFSHLKVRGTEFSDAGLTPLLLTGGNIDMAHVTVANYYLFAAPSLPLVTFNHVNAETAVEGSSEPMMKATFANCIFYGMMSGDMSITDFAGTDVWIRRCLFKSAGTDDDHFINCIWETDPIYYVDRNEYIFDYRLKPDSPAAAAADPALTPADAAVDFYGVTRPATGASLGAYQFTPPEEEP